ncbi:hypothetical protein RDABS01_015514 [Bienertia sinuspersici]
MEAQKSISRKRKQSSLSSPANSNPFSGILTRHKSQKFFFHHNRSGKSRKSRAFPSSFTNPNLPTTQRLVDRGNHDVSGAHDDEIYNISIKDLRARRVFSKPPKSDVVAGKNVVPKFDSESIVSELDESGVKFDGNEKNVEIPSLSVTGECDSGVELKDEVLDDGNPNLTNSEKCDDSGVDLKEGSNEGNPNLSNVEKDADSTVNIESKSLNGENPKLSIEGLSAKDDCGGGVSDDVRPNLRSKDLKSSNGEEENVQTTPPDAVVLARQIRSTDSRSPPKRISAEAKKSSRRNLVLNPCSRMKVYKVPNSFSYKRLLPFLKELANDSPSAHKVSPSIKIENHADEKPVDSSCQENVIDSQIVDEKPVEIAVACESQEMDNVSNEEEKLSLNPQTNDSNTPINCQIENSQENQAIDESQTGTPVSDYSKNGGASLDSQDSLDKAENLEDINPMIESDLAVTLHSPKRCPKLSNEDTPLDTPSHLPLDVDSSALVEFKSEKSPLELTAPPSASKQEAVVSQDEDGFRLARGILKRNPRGCRGVCNCLNCASFRLNAEKAFEFSRNQWLDAEELTMDLMKELSNIRCMLEKSVDGTNDNAIVPVDQVHEFCRRASTAEDIARDRLSQMNEDLHAHCRSKVDVTHSILDNCHYICYQYSNTSIPQQPLQRPRVKFSGSIQEKITGDTNLRR